MPRHDQATIDLLTDYFKATEVKDPSVGYVSVLGQNTAPTDGPATLCASLEAGIPQVIDDTINPVKVFDRELPPDEIAEAYRPMDTRTASKELIRA